MNRRRDAHPCVECAGPPSARREHVPGPAARAVTNARRYCARVFSEAELALIRTLIAEHDPPLNRAALSRVVCERLDWRKPDGGLKLVFDSRKSKPVGWVAAGSYPPAAPSCGRNAHCCAPPAQIRTWSLNHPAPTSGN